MYAHDGTPCTDSVKRLNKQHNRRPREHNRYINIRKSVLIILSRMERRRIFTYQTQDDDVYKVTLEWE